MKLLKNDNSFKYTIRSVELAFNLIEILAKGKMEYTISELMAKTQLPKGTVYRLLGTLNSLGYITHSKKKHTYYLTFKFSRIGIAMNERIHILEIIPHMKKLAKEFREMVNLAILDQGQVVYLYSIESPHTLKLDFKVGTYQPAYCTALGRVLLAYQDENILKLAIGEKRLTAYTSKTITDPYSLKEIFQKTREQGYSFVSEEYRTGICCLAGPIFDEKGDITAAISFSLPTVRLEKDILQDMIQAIKATTSKVKLPKLYKP